MMDPSPGLQRRQASPYVDVGVQVVHPSNFAWHQTTRVLSQNPPSYEAQYTPTRYTIANTHFSRTPYDITQGQTIKRRKLNSSTAQSAQQSNPITASTNFSKNQMCGPGAVPQPSPGYHWDGPNDPATDAPGSPLGRQLAHLGAIFSPCFHGTRFEGYQSVSQSDSSYPMLNTPYYSEKPPVMPIKRPSASKTRQVAADGPRSPAKPTQADGLAFGSQPPSYFSATSNSVFPLVPSEPNGQQLPTSGLHQEPYVQLNTGTSSYSHSGRAAHPFPLTLDGDGTGDTGTMSENFATEQLHPFGDSQPLNTMEALRPWNEAALDHHPRYDVLIPGQRAGKRGPFRDPSLREETAKTRKLGSCIRCRMQRIRCENNPEDSGGACLTCKKVANSRAVRFPCLRYKVTDIRLYKPGQVPGYEWSSRWTTNISDPIQLWASNETRVIRISEGYSAKYVELQVRQFVPQEGDKLVRTWDYNGTQRSVSIPPYALVDLEHGRQAYVKHIRSSMGEVFQTILGRSGGLIYQTYQQLLPILKDPTVSKETRDLLELAVKLWMAVRFSTRSGWIVGEETLGMPQDILDETSPIHGKIPLPPVLGAQLDVILIHHIQTQLRRELLDKFQRMVLKNSLRTWFVRYLVTFMLLHNASLIIEHDAGYARKHGMNRRFAREDKVREYHLGANILLAHFHYCNKGMHPFSDACSDEDLQTLADLNEDQIKFVHATRSFARKHRREWENVWNRGAYEDEYYFVSQLFEESWNVRSMGPL